MPRVYVGPYTDTSQSEVDIPLVTANAVRYLLFGRIVPANDGVNLVMEVTDDAFVSTETGTSYGYVDGRANATTTTVSGAAGATSFIIATNVGFDTNEHWIGEIKILQPHDTGEPTSFITHHNRVNSAAVLNVGYGGGEFSVDSDVDGIRLEFSAGNIASYNLHLFADTTA